jgi:hypothetical protein
LAKSAKASKNAWQNEARIGKIVGNQSRGWTLTKVGKALRRLFSRLCLWLWSRKSCNGLRSIRAMDWAYQQKIGWGRSQWNS